MTKFLSLSVALPAFALLAGTSTSCGRFKLGKAAPETKWQQADITAFNALQNPAVAPDAIRNAAAATFKVLSPFDNSSGTGSFISADGLMMTNNHVMGAGLCPAAGCYVTIYRDFEVGKTYSGATQVFGKPQFASVELDVAILQLQSVDSSGTVGDRIASPNFLSFAAATSTALVGSTTYVVGHPNGALKKWSAGQVYEADGKWFRNTNFSLGGNSGSPVLNSDGKIVGILHRGPDRSENITAHDLETYSICSSSQAILDVYKPGTGLSPQDGMFLNLADNQLQSDDDVLNRPAAFFNGRALAIKDKDGTKAVPDLLNAKCDANLALSTAPSTLEDLNTQLLPCRDAQAFVWCDSKSPRAGTTCPTGAAKDAWHARNANVAAKIYGFNGALPLDWLTYDASLESDWASEDAAAEKTLGAFLAANQPPVSFSIALYMAANPPADGTLSYAGVDLAAYVKNYNADPYYAYHASTIASAATWLKSNGFISKDELSALLHQLLADDAVDIRDRLTAERLAYMRKML